MRLLNNRMLLYAFELNVLAKNDSHFKTGKGEQLGNGLPKSNLRGQSAGAGSVQKWSKNKVKKMILF